MSSPHFDNMRPQFDPVIAALLALAVVLVFMCTGG